MVTMVTVIFGAGGYVGRKFTNLFNFSFAPSSSEVDASNYKELEAYLDDIRPDRIINCAGFTGKPNVDQCEKPDVKSAVIDGNIKIPLNLADYCLDKDIQFGHVSSGCIYSGTGGFGPDDEPNFTYEDGSFYSTTKAIAERMIKPKGAYIWRLRIPFDGVPDPRNYITKLLTYDKVFGAPNSYSELGDFAVACLKSFKQDPRVFNLTNQGYLEFEEVVELLKRYLPEAEKLQVVDFPKNLIAPRSNCTLEADPLMDLDVRAAFETALQIYRFNLGK